MPSESKIEIPTKALSQAGPLLAFAGLALPIAAIFAEYIPAYKGGEIAGQTTMLALLAFGVRRLIFRNGPTNAKAMFGIAIGILSVAWAGTAIVQSWHAERLTQTFKQDLAQSAIQARETALKGAGTPTISQAAAQPRSEDPKIEFMRQTKALMLSIAQESGDIDRRLNELDVADALKPETLTSREGISVAEGKVSKYVLLLDEIANAIKNRPTRFHSMIAATKLNETEKRQAIAGFDAKFGHVLQPSEDLDAARRATVRHVTRLLSFAKNELGKTALENGQILFKDQATLTQYENIISALNAASEREGAAEMKVLAIQKAAAADLERQAVAKPD